MASGHYGDGAASDVVGSNDFPEAAERIMDVRFRAAFSPERASAKRRSPLTWTSAARRGHRPIIGAQHFLTETEGSGYWEFSRFSDHFSLSATNATYRQNQWFQVPGWRFFKLRLLLAGQLLGARGEILATGPQAHLYLSPGTSEAGYFITGGQEIKLIVLHCRAELLEQTLGLNSADLPSPLKAMTVEGSPSSMHRISLSVEARHAAQRIFDSRHGVPSVLRAAYLESMTTTILCEVLGELLNRDLVQRSASGLDERDLNRIYEARDYLAQHFAEPPTIPQLARMVGTNQTKLKAGFKEVLGLTIHQYIRERRMELAAELLLTRKRVTEIAYQVGYEYPTNFTYAFKKHFGYLPREWKKQH